MLNQRYKDFSKLIVYQIYPRSFFDSNGDGIGDLNGITQKVSHLKELGVNAVWLSPCYKSPNVDNGYDISDYRDIMDEFGTMDDWKCMIKTLHDNGIKLIMDLVPNHTSDKHEWFIQSKKGKDNPYSDYYYWFDTPPNDWQACFGGSAYEYSPERGQYYLHSYAVEQPDLNFDNPKVREEVKAIIDFWVDLGVDGFRIDVIDQISKDFENGNNYFGENLHKYINELFGREKTAHLYTVGECWAESIEEVINHCGQDRKELSSLFQFDHITHGRKTRFEPKPFNISEITSDLDRWQKLTIENDILYTLFMDNHDNPRFLSRFGCDKKYRYESASMFAGMFYLQRGIPFIYQGQEFGMTNSFHSDFSSFRDVENLHYYNFNKGKMKEKELMERINFGSRDNARRPLSWTGEKHAGFSETEPWIPTYSEYKKINLEKDKKSKKSVFYFYKKLLSFRMNSDVVIYGDYANATGNNQNCYAYLRSFGEQKLLVVCNFGVKNSISFNYKNAEYLFGNYKGGRKTISGSYRPFELAVYKI